MQKITRQRRERKKNTYIASFQNSRKSHSVGFLLAILSVCSDLPKIEKRIPFLRLRQKQEQGGSLKSCPCSLD